MVRKHTCSIKEVIYQLKHHLGRTVNSQDAWISSFPCCILVLFFKFYTLLLEIQNSVTIRMQLEIDALCWALLGGLLLSGIVCCRTKKNVQNFALSSRNIERVLSGAELSWHTN